MPCCSSSVFWIRYATIFWTPASYSAEPFFGTGCLLTAKVALRYSCISSSNDACVIGWPLISATLPFGAPDELLEESPHAATSIDHCSAARDESDEVTNTKDCGH